jgi:1-aminocyclopropane-1-carboxylate deaminase/D-cysteine desulfhydrase-like pyridoxal-dependent ACC family enzyme
MAKEIRFENFQEHPPIVSINSIHAKKAGVNLYLKREDLIHEGVSGNKWRKLKYNLFQAREEGKKILLTFGGAFSNHIAAVAEAGALWDFETIGIIRGEKPTPLNITLRKAKEKGMRLVFVSRTEYRNKAELISKYFPDLQDTYIIPEGGTNKLALKGCSEIVTQCSFKENIDYWCVACGTGGTAAGMISGLKKGQKLIAIPVLKGSFMTKEIRKLLELTGEVKGDWSVNDQYHFGGYAKYDSSLVKFINDFKKDFAIPLDPIYTGKLLFGVFDLVTKGFFPRGANVMVVHTGGLQGISGFNERFGDLIQ